MLFSNEIKRFYFLVSALLIVGWTWTLYYTYKDLPPDDSNFSMCLVRSVTGLPCPSCGTTHSISALLSGKFLIAARYNLLGYLALIFMIIFPLWILTDAIQSKQSLYNNFIYIKSKKSIIYLFLTLIAINWIWNLCKMM